MKLTKIMKTNRAALVIAAALACTPSIRAQGIPVYDNASVLQQIQQVISWGKQLEEMKNHLTQMKATYDSLNGLRDIGGLMNNQLLNQYLPKDYQAALADLKSGKAGAFNGISGSLNDIIAANQYWTCKNQSAKPAEQAACTKQWQELAVQRKVGDLGYQQAATNIDNLQQFITGIKTAPDAKTMQDLAARIQVEQVRMQNEQIKLQTVEMMRQADERLRQQASMDNFQGAMKTGVRTVDF